MSRGGPRSSAHGATTTPNMSDLDLLCRGAPVTASTDTPRLLLSTEQVAQALAVSPRFVKNLIYSGELPSCRVGRLRRIYIGNLCAWIETLRDAGARQIAEKDLRRRSRPETRVVRYSPQCVDVIPLSWLGGNGNQSVPSTGSDSVFELSHPAPCDLSEHT